MTNNLRIKFYCRSFDLRLYRLSKALYESWGYECVRLTDQSADGYFYTMLREDCDIAINVDEDCFITNKEAVLELVEYVVANGIANAGCSDAGAGVPRGGDPKVTNPFFNIFDLRLLREHFSRDAVANYDDGTRQKEPYYPFFRWMCANYKILYLEGERHPDGMTTILYNHQHQEMCRHTWLARFYSTPAFLVKHWMPQAGAQQQRINSVINEAYAAQHINKPVFDFSDELAFVGNKILRWCIKVPQRIMNWPNKLKRKKLRK